MNASQRAELERLAARRWAGAMHAYFKTEEAARRRLEKVAELVGLEPDAAGNVYRDVNYNWRYSVTAATIDAAAAALAAAGETTPDLERAAAERERSNELELAELENDLEAAADAYKRGTNRARAIADPAAAGRRFDELARRANHLGYPSIADAIGRRALEPASDERRAAVLEQAAATLRAALELADDRIVDAGEILPAGTRVRFAHDVDRYPHFIAPAGATGRVVDVGDDQIALAVRLDEPLAGAEEWDNEVHWFAGDDPAGALELVDDHSAGRRLDVLAAEAPHLIAPANVVVPMTRPQAELLAGIVDFGGVDNDNLSDDERELAQGIADTLRRVLEG